MHRAGLGRLRGGRGEPRQKDYTARKMEPDTYTSHPLGLLSKLGCRCSLHRPVTRPTHHPNSSIDLTLSPPVTHRGRTAPVSPHPSRSRLSPTAVSLVVCSRVSPTHQDDQPSRPDRVRAGTGLKWTGLDPRHSLVRSFFLPSYVPRQCLFFFWLVARQAGG